MNYNNWRKSIPTHSNAREHKTIAEFRKKNASALKKIFKDFVRLCIAFNLYGKELVAIDGSKVKAWNSKENNFTVKKLGGNVRRKMS